MRALVPAGAPSALGKRRLSGPWDRPLLGTDGVNSSTSDWVTATATASATPHTKGAWTEILAATTHECGAVDLYVVASTSIGGAASDTLLDLGVGAGGAESVVIGDILAGWKPVVNAVPNPHLGLFPLRVPVGSRLAIRCQSVVASKTTAVGIRLRRPVLSRTPPVRLLTVGTTAASSRGTVLSTPGGANTKGAWTEIVASVTQPLSGFVVGVGGGADATQANAQFLVDIGMGSAGNEQVIAADLRGTSSSSTEGVSLDNPGVFAADIPAGARLVARYAASSTSGTLDVSLIGVPA